MISLMAIVYSCGRPDSELTVVYSDAIIPEDVVAITDSLVKPIIYKRPIPLGVLDIDERKQTFIDMFLPSILIVRYKLNRTLRKVELIALKDSSQLERSDRIFIESLFAKYKTNDLKELQEKLLPHPTSLVLAQAAIESAWGTSRFYTEACNPFGIWSFDEHEPRIRANIPRPEGTVYLRKFSNIYQSIEEYYFTIATGPYQKFRKNRMNTTDVYKLIHHLDRYSEMGSFYINQMSEVIRTNNLTMYDHFQIDPAYIKKRIIVD